MRDLNSHGGFPPECRTRAKTNSGLPEWTFEPGVALKILNDFVRDAGVTVVYSERIDLGGGVRKRGNRIHTIRMESGRQFRGRMFIISKG